MRLKTAQCCAFLAVACALMPAQSAPAHLVVDAGHPGVKISPALYGLMTEEINHSYDGGLYGELIQNRSFKDNAQDPAHWSLVQEGSGAGEIALDTAQPVNSALSVSLKLMANAASAAQRVGVANEGYWGIPVKPNTSYRASFYAKGDVAGPLTISIESSDGQTIHAKAQVAHISSAWAHYSVTLKTGKVTPSTANRFVISTNAPGTVWLSLVSLFPPTFHNRPNGNRVDLMQKMAAMKPAFLRFPGGNYVDPGHYQWKITLGPISQRTGHPGAWGYRSSDGLGLLEFFLWCEDLKMEPVLAVTDGRGWLPRTGDVAPLVQDALDEIEYATGSVGSKWGAKRAADGHPAPFPLRFIEVGNEDFFDPLPVYEARFAKFYDAIRAKYPALQIIATRGIKDRRPDIVDDHYYRSAVAMENDAHHYDEYDRTGPKIFVGEWATTEGSPTPTMQAALGDAAWLTGLERNSDLVILSCYAPLLVNVNRGARQWGTNLIGYDALNSFGSPSYYMQTMFNNNRGDVVLPVDIAQPDAAPVTAAALPKGAVGVGTWATQAEFKDITVTHGGATLYQSHLDTGDADWKLGAGTWAVQAGALQQTDGATDCRAVVGSADWTDYTYSVKARKLSGAEGFLVLFHVQNRDDFIWWNIGGWQNSRSGLERSAGGAKTELGPSAPVTVETGRWYDIKIEVEGRQIRCFLDGKLITQAMDRPAYTQTPLFATASRELKTGDVILKVVNTAADSQPLQIDLRGVPTVGRTATGQVLAGQPQDVNTIDAPEKVAPKLVIIKNAGKTFTHEFPAHSVSVIRLKTR